MPRWLPFRLTSFSAVNLSIALTVQWAISMQNFGHILINDRKELKGQILGKVHVASGGRLLLSAGQIVGTLTIDEGGEAEVRGQVCGLVNNQGSLALSGQIVGLLRGRYPVNALTLGQIVGIRRR